MTFRQEKCRPERSIPKKIPISGEVMTGPQRSYLQTLCREAREEFNPSLTKAEASKKIDELRQKPVAARAPRPDASTSSSVASATA